MKNIVKITSGEYRGRSLLTPGGKTHPMGSREKLALFNMVAGDLPGAKVLDAFAGSGALGIEAISREATEVVFVEKDAKAARIIRDNLANLGLSGQIFIGDVSNFTSKEEFDLIIADPPYDDFRVATVAHLANYLKIGGKMILSHPGVAPEIKGLTLLKSRGYAGATLSAYVK